MTPKKTPRPKPRKTPNRQSSIVNRKSQQTCLNCRYWSMWDHSCATRAAALDDFSPVHPDTPACSEFQPE